MRRTVTTSQINALYAYWAEIPPVHVSVASFLGAKPGGSDKNKNKVGAGGRQYGSLEELMAIFPGGTQVKTKEPTPNG